MKAFSHQILNISCTTGEGLLTLLHYSLAFASTGF